MFLSFVNNISLLLALSICHSFILQRWNPKTKAYQTTIGILFGCITVAGMMNPFVLSEGIIFDGRSFVASIAGLMGGPITAALVVVIGGAYRIWGVGGGGTVMGACVLATSAILGVLYRLWLRDERKQFRPLYLYLFGILVHLGMLIWMLTLPSAQISNALKNIAPPVMLIFPICTVVLGKMLKGQIDSLSLHTALRSSEENYRVLVESANSIILRLDIDGNITFINEYAQKFFGYTEREIIGRPAVGTIIPETESTGRDLSGIVQSVIDDPDAYTLYENENLLKSGEIVWVTWTNKVIFDENGAPAEILCIGTDRTKPRRIEETLQESERQYKLLADNLTDVIWTVDLNLQYTYVSPSVERMMGFTVEENLTKSVRELLTPASYETVQKVLAEELDIEKSADRDLQRTRTLELEQFRKDGSTVWVEITMTFLRDSEGNADGILGVSRDISERKQAEVDLRESKNRYQAFFEHGMDGVVILDPETTQIVEFNDRACRQLGYSREEFARLRVPDIDVNETIEETRAHIERIWREGYGDFETRQRTKQGEIKDIHVTAQVIETGKRNLYHCLWRDVTERKRMEDALRESEAKFRHLFEDAPIGIFCTNAEGRALSVNRAMAHILGFKSSEETLQYYTNLGVQLYYDERRRNEFIQILKEKGYVKDFQYEAKTVDGRRIWLAMNARIQNCEGSESYVIEGFTTDITERKKAEDSLLQASQRMALAADSAGFGIWDLDLLQNLLTWDDWMFRLYGVERDRFNGVYEAWMNGIHPDDMERATREVNLAVNGEKDFDTEFRIVRPDGEVRYIKADAVVVKDGSGRPVRMTGVNYDITERKRMELEKEKLQLQLLQTQKMEALGTLAGGIAHDFNNILAGIMGFTELTLHEIEPAREEIRENLQMVLSSAHRAKNLVKQILAFSRRKDLEKISFIPSLVVKECLQLLRSTLPTTIDIRQRIEAASQSILGEPSQIHQVLMNLGTNAAYAMRESGGVLDVSLTEETLDSSTPVLPFFEVEPGRYLCLQVKDTGKGIPPEICNKVFDPFFTTKDKSEGTGLGLSVVLGIVKSHNGAMAMESAVGEGTAFRIYLPFCEERSNKAESSKNVPKGNGERVLVVDDESAIVKLNVRMLESLNYKAAPCLGSEEALASFRADPNGFDLVLTDQTMPKMKGIELAREIKTIRPGVPIILNTGYDERLQPEELEKAGVCEMLMKPFSTNELAQALARRIK